MKYYFTEDQWDVMWECIPELSDPDIATIMDRILVWNRCFGVEYHLQYDENNDEYPDDDMETGYWGLIEGNEKHINWFVLKYL